MVWTIRRHLLVNNIDLVNSDYFISLDDLFSAEISATRTLAITSRRESGGACSLLMLRGWRYHITAWSHRPWPTLGHSITSLHLPLHHLQSPTPPILSPSQHQVLVPGASTALWVRPPMDFSTITSRKQQQQPALQLGNLWPTPSISNINRVTTHLPTSHSNHFRTSLSHHQQVSSWLYPFKSPWTLKLQHFPPKRQNFS